VRVALRSARQPRKVPLPLFPVLSLSAGVVWFAVTVLGLLVLWWRSGDGLLASSLTAADVQQLTAPFVAGFLLQVLFGAMSYLLPVTLRGGPRATTAALAAMSRFAVLRVVTYNLALVLLVLADMGGTAAEALFSALTLGTTEVSAIGSLSRVVISLLAFGVLVSFPVLLVTAVRASAKHRRTALPMPTAAPATGSSRPLVPSSGARAGTSPGTGTATSPAPTDSRAGGEATNRPQMRPDGLDRRALTSVLLGLGSVLGVTALGSALDRAQG